jgi:hypothetical protein
MWVVYTDIFASLRNLADTRKNLYAKDGTYVLDLATPATPR